jgi:hypothetical protein
MNIFRSLFRVLLPVLAVWSWHPSQGQSTLDLRINEILVCNDSNYVDDFGSHSPWIEIFNSAYNQVNVGGLYLTDDLANPTKYLITKGQPVTSIPSRGYLVFWADSFTSRGILHLNFRLAPGKTIALFENNGKTLIDSMTVPLFPGKDVSYGRFTDGADDKGILEKTTPKADNNTRPVITSGEAFAKFDPRGTGMTVIAMGVVFIALALLYLIFKMTSRFLKKDFQGKLIPFRLSRSKESMPGSAPEARGRQVVTGEINAVIAMTLYLYSSEMHDAENTVLTINKVSRTYSPWSSKIYGIRKTPN